MTMVTENLLIELGTEELPPKALRKLAEAFAENFTQELTKAELAFERVEWFAAPRRLALKVHALATTQQDKQVEKRVQPSALPMSMASRHRLPSVGPAPTALRSIRPSVW